MTVWWQSAAYGHCFLVLPMAAYLAWTRRAAVAGSRCNPCLGPPSAGLPLAIAWLAANRLGVMEASQFAALGFLELLFLAVLGWRICRALAVPLLYLLFLVPFGSFPDAGAAGFHGTVHRHRARRARHSAFRRRRDNRNPAGDFLRGRGLRRAALPDRLGRFRRAVRLPAVPQPGPPRRLHPGGHAGADPRPTACAAWASSCSAICSAAPRRAATDHLLYGWVFFSLVIVLLTLAGLPWREDHAQAAAPRSAA